MANYDGHFKPHVSYLFYIFSNDRNWDEKMVAIIITVITSNNTYGNYSNFYCTDLLFDVKIINFIFKALYTLKRAILVEFAILSSDGISFLFLTFLHSVRFFFHTSTFSRFPRFSLLNIYIRDFILVFGAASQMYDAF